MLTVSNRVSARSAQPKPPTNLLALLCKKASLAGAFFVAAIWLPGVWAFCPAPVGLPLVKVQRVVDGDTLRLVDGRSVRMIGLNTPETGKKDQPAEPLAERAKRRLQALVNDNGGSVGLRLGEQGRDHYGRTLAHVYGRDGRNLEAQLLSEGLGFQVAVVPNVALVDCQRQAEDVARRGRLGLWRDWPVIPATRVDKDGFALVSGRVDSVRRNAAGVWIELQGGVVLRIAPPLLGRFDGKALERLQGRQVQARGWVVDRSRRGGLRAGRARWLIPLTHPLMLRSIAD